MKRSVTKGFLLAMSIVVTSVLQQCKKDPPVPTYDPTPYILDIPAGFPAMDIPEDNPMTVEGVELGRKLFYDPILSRDSTLSCASCHLQELSFSDDGGQFSEGIDAQFGVRNAPALINLGWVSALFWDGRAMTLEEQALEPVPNPIEMDLSWKTATARLNRHRTYPDEFYLAFGTKTVDSLLVAKAIAQFERTLITAGSRFDAFAQSGPDFDLSLFTPSELNGLDIFSTERGDCFHCHGGVVNLTLSDNEFRNNGLDATSSDLGLGAVTGNVLDNGKFRSFTLRNIALTAPYMHDGRFATLEEVVDHYSEGLQQSPTIDPLMKQVNQGGVQLSVQEKADLVAFLNTFTDSSFISNPAFSNPFK